MVEERYFNVQETAKFLKISISILHRLIKQNMIPSYKVECRRLVDKDELIEWVKTQRGDGQP